jgi:Flp pilus assembly protein TadG
MDSFTHRRQPSGFAAIYTVIILIALCGIVSLGVDLGRVQLAKAELQTAADAAARAAAVGISTSANQAIADAVAVAAANKCDGSAVVLNAGADVELGTWNSGTKTFTALSGAAANSATAVRVTTRRLASRGTAIPLVFAKVVGRQSCDVKAVAIASASGAAGTAGFVGLNGITMNNNGFFGSYLSSTSTNPTQATAASKARVGTNGTITVKNNNTVRGDVQLGPAGAISGSLAVSGATSHLSSTIPAPASPSWNPSTNPGGIAQNYTVNSATTLPGGTYWFTALTLNANLSFSAPATVYVNGNITIDAALTASGSVPANLKIYQLGSSRTFGDSKNNSISVTAVVEAPGANLVSKNKLTFKGAGTFGTITAKNSADFFCDEAVSASGTSRSIALVQ